MVDRPVHGTIRPKLLDSIPFFPNRSSAKSRFIVDSALKRNLSASQIADELGVSKTCVIETLQRQNVLRPKKGSLTNPKNYRHYVAPCGHSSKGGRLVLNKKEVKVCRLIVSLCARDGLSFSRTAQRLMELGIKTRTGKSRWDHSMVSLIIKRWKDKI